MTTLLACLSVFVAAAILAPFTFGISLIALLFVCLYAMAVAVVGDRGGFGALVESYRITLERFGMTVKIILLQLLVSFLGSVVAVAFAALPLLGPFCNQIIQQVFAAYFTLVVVGVYLGARAEQRA